MATVIGHSIQREERNVLEVVRLGHGQNVDDEYNRSFDVA